MKINELQKEAFAIADEKGWHERPRPFGELIALIHSEVTEAFEARRNGLPINETVYGDGNKPEGVPSEFADIVIRTAETCEELGIDLEAAIIEKLEYNKKRPYRHGGKLF